MGKTGTMLPEIRRSFLLVLFAAVLWRGGTEVPAGAALKVTHEARSLRPGEVVLLKVESPRPLRRLEVAVFEREFPAFTDGDGLTWTSLVGIDLDTRPDRYTVKISGYGSNGNPVTGQDTLIITPRKFPTRHLTVDERYVSPPPELLARIKEESEKVRAIFDSVSRQRYWSAPFEVPVPGPPISSFGTRSVYNRQPRSPHSGTDFRGAAGTPVRAPNAGKVVLAADLYYSGNTLILDHGFGLYSYFGHLSAFSVQEGDRVNAGQVLGKVGATGLATGPHLHWAVRLVGTRVDPLSLLGLLGQRQQDVRP